jgi:regulator of cell morphogenesis and NO signaling
VPYDVTPEDTMTRYEAAVMKDLDLDSSVTEWLIDQPQLLKLFESLGIEYGCGGKSLRRACIEQELSPEDVLKQCDYGSRRQHG